MAKSINMDAYVNFAKQVFGNASLPTIIITEMLWDTSTTNEKIDEILQIFSYWYTKQCLVQNSVQITQTIIKYIVYDITSGKSYSGCTLKDALTQALYGKDQNPRNKNNLIHGQYATVFEWYINEGREDNRINVMTDDLNKGRQKYKDIVEEIYKNNDYVKGR